MLIKKLFQKFGYISKLEFDSQLEVLHQTLLEVRHAQESGKEWYTRGEIGLRQQVDMWLSKGFKAIESIRE